MQAQLNKLMSVSSLTNVTLQVLPFNAGASPAFADGGFTIMGFDPGWGQRSAHLGAGGATGSTGEASRGALAGNEARAGASNQYLIGV